jgi:FkbM family methyltransferase
MRVLDLGGNIGLFGLYAFARFSIEEMTSFEPDPSNVALLRETIRINGYETKWSVEQVAVGTRDGRLPFAALGAPESRAAARGEPAIEVPIIDLFNVRKPVELMKIDIEGGEWALLGDPRLRAFDASVIIVE